MIKKITTLIIGGGKIAEQHLIALQAIDIVSVAGICDLSPSLAQFTAKRFGIPNWFTDYKQMLNQCTADVVHVLTPPATHNSIVRTCFEFDMHVIVEKPIALSNMEFKKLWNLAASKGLQLIENHNYRFNEPIEKLKKAVNEDKIGDIKEVEIRLALDIRSGGRYADVNFPHPSHQLPAGIIHEFITHMAYLLLHFIPEGCIEHMESVRAAWRNYGGGNLFKYDALDAAVFSDGIIGKLNFSSNQWPDAFTVKLRGTEGKAVSELYHPLCVITGRRSVGQHLTPLVNSISAARTIRRAGFGSLWNKIRNKGAYEGLRRFIDLTYQALNTGIEPPVTYKHMDEASRLVDLLLLQENRI